MLFDAPGEALSSRTRPAPKVLVRIRPKAGAPWWKSGPPKRGPQFDQLGATPDVNLVWLHLEPTASTPSNSTRNELVPSQRNRGDKVRSRSKRSVQSTITRSNARRAPYYCWQSNKTQASSRRGIQLVGKLETNSQTYGDPGCAEDGLLPCRRMQEGSNPSIPYRTDVLGALPGWHALDGRLPVGGPRKPLAEGGIWKPTLQTTVAQERHSAYLALFVSPHSR